jgi:hypothetical protein
MLRNETYLLSHIPPSDYHYNDDYAGAATSIFLLLLFAALVWIFVLSDGQTERRPTHRVEP